MSTILITGGTGNLGRSLTKISDKNNVSYTIGSRHNKTGAANIAVIDLLLDKGIKESVAGKQLIFHRQLSVFDDITERPHQWG